MVRSAAPSTWNYTYAHVSTTSVLTLSMRRMSDLVGYSGLYEFEDVLHAVTAASRVEATGVKALEFWRRSYKYARLLTGSRGLAHLLAPRPGKVQLEREYDLFLPVFNHPHELYALALLPQWRRHCRLGACFIVELWPHLLPSYLLEMLASFDHIFLGTRNTVSEVARISGRPCSYLPLAADVLTFAPRLDRCDRVIDVCNIGRRSPVTHAALVALARQRSIVYHFDTVAASGEGLRQRTFHVENPSEHRLLLASTLQRSRYFIANRARINEPDFVAQGDEISGRFYEGTASGTVMLGEAPRCDEFARQFDWPDALIRMPFDAPWIGSFLEQLDGEPQRLARIRRDNVCHAARRHDWTYRVRAVFETLGLAPTDAMHAREAELQSLASHVAGEEVGSERFDSERTRKPARPEPMPPRVIACVSEQLPASPASAWFPPQPHQPVKS